jgi:shikimate kinase
VAAKWLRLKRKPLRKKIFLIGYRATGKNEVEKTFEEEIRTTLNSRESLYRKFSFMHIDTEQLTPDKIAS